MERLDNSKLSPLQQRILEKMNDSHVKELAVVGGPGTGKTVLALSGMERGQDKKQLLITYSRPLSQMINNCGVTSLTLHQFGYRIGLTVENELKDYSDRYINGTETINDVIIKEYGYTNDRSWPPFRKLLAAYNRTCEKTKRELHYDTIFVDEGQDLPDEAYAFLKVFTDRLIVTYDEAQEVGTSGEVPATVATVRSTGVNCNRILGVLNLQDSFYDLIDNFRNTVAIERVAKLFYRNYGANRYSLREVAQVRSDGSKREGEKPRVIFSAVTQKLISQIADRAHQLSRSIGLILPDSDLRPGPDRDQFDLVKGLLEQAVTDELLPRERLFYKFGGDTNMKESDKTNGYGVFLLSYTASKGMEFDDVCLIDCQKCKLDTPSQKNRMYIAATRAKDRLSFVFDCDRRQSCPVLQVINEHMDCFDIRGTL